jgi:hypothetical protein
VKSVCTSALSVCSGGASVVTTTVSEVLARQNVREAKDAARVARRRLPDSGLNLERGNMSSLDQGPTGISDCARERAVENLCQRNPGG